MPGMKNYWTQPSLSRDFALLSVAIFTVLFFMSMWVTYTTYTKHTQKIATDLKTEANRVEMTLASEMERASYLLTALGRQIVVNNARDLVELAQILKAYDAKQQIYAVFNWVSVDQKVLVSSNRGILEKPVDISDRDFVKKAFVEPWKMHIGRPIEGRVSGRWVIPVGMGLTDYTGKFIGTILISLDINELTEHISTLVKRDGISFAIISKTLIPLTQVSDDNNFLANNFPAQKLVNIDYAKNPSGLISQGNMLWGGGSYNFYSVSDMYPYIILMGYDNRYEDDTVRNMLWSRLLQMMAIAIFFILFLIIVRNRLITPMMDVTDAIAQVARGNTNVKLPTGGPLEMNALAIQVNRVKEYIDESKRIDDELRNKIFTLKKNREEFEVSKHSKSEFLAYICQAMRSPMNKMLGYAQVMKDQIYGPIENKKYRQYAQDIYTGCNHVIAQLDDVLELARAEAHYTILREEVVDVGAIIKHASQMLADRMQSANITLKITLLDNAPMLYADEFRMQQIISNILLFFIEHEVKDAEIDFTVKLAQDNNQQWMNLVFAADFSIENDEAFNTQLELVKRLVMMHGGRVILANNGITVSLPGTRLRFVG